MRADYTDDKKLLLSHLINLFKGLTPAVILGLIWYYEAWELPAAWLYLGLHGSYGLLWLLKGAVFPDRSWQRPLTIRLGLFYALGLMAYWLAPWLLMSRQPSLPVWLFAVTTTAYAIGVVLHFAADLQKATALKLRPNTLIQDGLFARVRNINYFGELLIYLSFAALSWHWLPFLVAAAAVVFVWLPNMWAKDRSLARYPEFERYQQQSWLFIPFVY